MHIKNITARKEVEVRTIIQQQSFLLGARQVTFSSDFILHKGHVCNQWKINTEPLFRDLVQQKHIQPTLLLQVCKSFMKKGAEILFITSGEEALQVSELN